MGGDLTRAHWGWLETDITGTKQSKLEGKQQKSLVPSFSTALQGTQILKCHHSEASILSPSCVGPLEDKNLLLLLVTSLVQVEERL